MQGDKIVIIGAGPTGLGAAYRLRELGYHNWVVFEKNTCVGGLAASFTDDVGFTWDIGGHVLFSRYDYFDKLFEKVMARQYLEHDRKAFIRTLDRWVPYPFQNNLRYLPKEIVLECLTGLIDTMTSSSGEPPRTFLDWINAVLGSGIAKHFMVPYNTKMWAYPLDQMDKNWVANSVSVVDVKKALKNVILELDEVSWGINRTFKFPLRGGTGDLFARMVPYVKENLRHRHTVVQVNADKRQVVLNDGSIHTYDALINTAPLPRFVKMMTPLDPALATAADKLWYNSVLVVGVGLKKQLDSDTCWMYFPGPRSPFYRATFLSNYSPFNVPNGDVEHYSSIMCEVAYLDTTRPTNDDAIERTLHGLIAEGLIENKDRDSIVSTYLIEAEYAYPIPTLERDAALRVIQPHLESYGIYSRGRFGAWRYETSSMDHSVMMGVEVVDRILKGTPEQTWVL